MLTREKLIDALARLPRHDQLIVDWLKSEGFSREDFIRLVTPMEGRGELVKAGLRLRVASYHRSHAHLCVDICGTRYADIKGRG